jgi:hypothetical protein
MTRTAKTTKVTLAKIKSAQKRHARQLAKIEAGLIEAGTVYVKNAIQYKVRKDGVHERMPTRDHPVTREEVVFMLTNVRALEQEDVLHFIGKGAMDFMLQHDLLRKLEDGLLWITTNAQRKYGLQNPMLPSGVRARYVK